MDGKLFALGGLSHVVLEGDLYRCVDDRLVARVGDDAIEIAHGCAGEILRGTGFQIREFQIGGVGRWLGGLFLLGAQDQGENSDYDSDDCDSDQDGTQTGLRRFGGGIYVRLEQAAHGAIVLLKSYVRITTMSNPR